jgi:predicted RNA methylase
MFVGHYIEWRKSRMAGIKKYIQEDFFKSKTLLELGCGCGDIGNEFSQLGTIVSCCDARKEKIEIVKKRYPEINTFLYDGDKEKIEIKYDIILHWGLLYHLHEIENHLENILKKCDILLLETEISNSTVDTHYIKTEEKGSDQAYNSIGIRPSQSYVEKIIKKNGFNYLLIKDPILNTENHKYNLELQNTNTYEQGKRRYWICWKSKYEIINFLKETIVNKPNIVDNASKNILPFYNIISLLSVEENNPDINVNHSSSSINLKIYPKYQQYKRTYLIKNVLYTI